MRDCLMQASAEPKAQVKDAEYGEISGLASLSCR